MGKKLFTNGTIITQHSRIREPEAVLVAGDRVVFTGPKKEALRRGGQDCQIKDLKGNTLIPGFNDNHLHLLSAGDHFFRVKLYGLDTPAIIHILKEAETQKRKGEMLEGMGWDYKHVPFPDKKILDTHFPDRPVVLYQYGGHTAWVNTAMLKRIGINTRTRNPRGGEIGRGTAGRPNGILKNAATHPLHRIRMNNMNNNPLIREKLLDSAQYMLNSVGITSVQDNTWVPHTAAFYRRQSQAGRLKLRISVWGYGPSKLGRFLMSHVKTATDWTSRGPDKFFADGTFNSRTAWLLEEYSNDPGNTGIPVMQLDYLRKIIRAYARARRQLAIHAIGDRGIHEIINAVEAANEQSPWVKSLRFRIEHAQIIKQTDIKRLSSLGICIAAQPSALINPQLDIDLLGNSRQKYAYPYRRLLDEGVPLSFGSDVPGESLYTPLEIMHLAVNRAAPVKISAAEALYAYTAGSAYAEFSEAVKGKIAPGYLADFAILDNNPLSCREGAIKNINVLETIVGGRTVYSDYSAAGE